MAKTRVESNAMCVNTLKGTLDQWSQESRMCSMWVGESSRLFPLLSRRWSISKCKSVACKIARNISMYQSWYLGWVRTDSGLQLDYYAFKSYVNECDFKRTLKFKVQLHTFYKPVVSVWQSSDLCLAPSNWHPQNENIE